MPCSSDRSLVIEVAHVISNRFQTFTRICAHILGLAFFIMTLYKCCSTYSSLFIDTFPFLGFLHFLRMYESVWLVYHIDKCFTYFSKVIVQLECLFGVSKLYSAIRKLICSCLNIICVLWIWSFVKLHQHILFLLRSG